VSNHVEKESQPMTSSFKPQGYNSVSPYLIVDGAAGTIAFLVRVFGATELRRFPDPSGKLMHAEVRVDDTVVMVADSAEGWLPVQSHVHVYVQDVDATYRRALDAGATSVQAPIKKEDEDKRGGVKDSGGTTWWISTKVE
jgi:PhnB protein